MKPNYMMSCKPCEPLYLRDIQEDLSAKVFDSFTKFGYFCIDMDAEHSAIFSSATSAALEFFASPMDRKVPFNVKLRNNKVRIPRVESGLPGRVDCRKQTFMLCFPIPCERALRLAIAHSKCAEK